MSPTVRPLRPLALVWAAFGILPYLLAAVMLGQVAPVTWGLLAVELAALGTTLTVVRSRVPVPWRRTATAAAFATFAFACVRFGVLTFMDPGGAPAGSAAEHAAIGHLLLLGGVVDAGFSLACLTLALTCGHALWRARATSGPGSAS